MVPRQGRPLQSWKIFLRNHGEGIASIDLFVVPTLAFQQLFPFPVLGQRRRQLLWFAVAQNPTAERLARQNTEAFPWDTAPKYLIVTMTEHLAARSRLECERWASKTGPPRSARPGIGSPGCYCLVGGNSASIGAVRYIMGHALRLAAKCPSPAVQS
jgi:hypothetical protein